MTRRTGRALILAAALLGGASSTTGASDTAPDYGARLERFTYPWPVRTMPVTIAGEAGEMAYMDVAPAHPNGRSVVLLHGKNFCGATWKSSVRALSGAGYRVLVPDQIGFCKSSKPERAQYSFAMLAALTHRLMQTRGIERASIVGHSIGGMLAMRFALQYPGAVDRLVLVDPLGLVDRAGQGVPYVDLDTLWAAERKTSVASIKAYQLANYYHGQWRPAYDRWVAMEAGMFVGPDRDRVALAQAKTSEMALTQPVAAELPRIAAPTTVIVGTLDRTAFGRAQLPPDRRASLSAIPAVAPAAVARMPHATLVRLDGLGHAPQVEDPARFEATLLAALGQGA